MSSCWSAGNCAASLEGTEKYIYYYGTQPDEVYDLSEDPLEERNLVSLYSHEELDKRREELLARLSKVDAIYRGPQ